MVGVTGFEPTTSASRTQRSNQAELHPDWSLLGTSDYSRNPPGSQLYGLGIRNTLSRRLKRPRVLESSRHSPREGIHDLE